MAVSYVSAKFSAEDAIGAPLVSGKLYTYLAGTTTPATTYQDSAGSSANTNPIVLDARGEAVVFLTSGTLYKFVLKTAADVTIYTQDNVDGLSGATTLAGSGGSSNVGYIASGAGAVARTVQSKLRDTISVFDFMTAAQITDVQTYAGTLDVTTPIQTAIAALANGQALWFPAGDYRINSGALRFNSKSKIRVYGDSAASTIIRQSSQGLSGSRVTNHSTMVFDQCADIVVENLNVQGKGSQYGDIPASPPAAGTARADSIANEFGVALAFTRCTGTVICRNVEARYPGDNSAFYASSCNRVVFENCFSNCASLGYAGINVDNWCDSSLGGRRYEFYNCTSWAESSVPAGLSTTYGSKGAVFAEGDNTKPLDVVVVGGSFRDCYIGSDAVTYGAALTATDCHFVARGVSTRNCYIGARLNKRGGVTDELFMDIAGCSFLDCGVSGVYVGIGSSTGGGRYSIADTAIECDATSAWSAQTGTAVEFSSGIVHDGFMNGHLDVIGCSITGAQYGFYGLDKSEISFIGCRISTLDYGLACHGAGRIQLNGNQIETSNSSSQPVYVTTLNKAASASRNSYLHIVGNTLKPAGDATTDFAVTMAGNSALFSETQIKHNIVMQGVLNISKGSATLWDVDDLMLQATQRVVAHGLTGANTYVEVNLPKEFLPTYAYAVGTDSTSRAVISQTNNSGGTRGRVRVVLTGDVRAQYDSAANVRVTVMQ